MKKLVAILLAVCMVLGLMTTVFAADAKSDDIVILHTNDAHCGVTDGLGYAGVAAYKAEMEATHNHVTLVDCGDAVQGDDIGIVSAGSYLVDIMNEVGYDYATFGNHEFDYKMPRLTELVAMAKYQYLSCNFQYTGTAANALAPAAYAIEDYGTAKVAFVGITTPETYVKSSPVYFKDDDGNFIYTFHESDLYAAVQAAVDGARKEGADYVVALAHLGIEGSTDKWTSESVIANTTGIDAMLDGHSHEAYSKTVANKDGDNVVLAQTGSKLAKLGKLTIAADGTITSELISAEKYTEKDEHITAFIKNITDSFASSLSEVVGKTDVHLCVNDENGKRIIRNHETNLGNLCADAYRTMMDADIGIMNGGGIRADIAVGDITRSMLMKVFPWGNLPCKIEVTGQTVLDMLEMGACNYPNENGGFLHVSGLKYTIVSSIPSSIEKTEKGEFVKVKGDYRVCNVQVLDKATNTYRPLNLKKTYSLAGIDYTILYCGDGFNMFEGAKVLTKADATYTDAKMLIDYVSNKLGGVVGKDYAAPQGRITFLTYKDVAPDAWYAAAVDYVTDEGIMNGTGKGFTPDGSLTRGQLVTMLYRQAGKPAVEGKVSETFTDCADGKWYSDAVLWAVQNKIVNGYGKVFKPDQAVTRQEMAKILYGYDMAVNGAEQVEGAALTYKDAADVASWALEGVAYCTVNKIMSGNAGKFSPTSTTTRAQGAQVFMNIGKLAVTEDAA